MVILETEMIVQVSPRPRATTHAGGQKAPHPALEAVFVQYI
jgi:hypothetical protein